MNAPHLLIWFKGGEAHATGLAELPEALAYEGKNFRPVTEYLGDADYLRDEQNRLVGFSYILGDASEHEEALHESLLAQSKSVKREDGMLVILLTPAAFEIQFGFLSPKQLARFKRFTTNRRPFFDVSRVFRPRFGVLRKRQRPQPSPGADTLTQPR